MDSSEAKKGWTKARREEDPQEWSSDFLTASYNFRYGVYGEIDRGRKYTVPTFPKKGPSSYEVNVASKEEEEKKRKSEKFKDGKEYFIKLLLDPEVTHSKEGLIEGFVEALPHRGRSKMSYSSG
jgi:hypothetical protein